MDKKAILAVTIAVVFVSGFAFWNSKRDQSGVMPGVDAPSGVVFYYGTECSHCKDVEAFLDEGKIADKVNFVRKEVWHDRTNAAEMVAAAKKCGLAEDTIGVPFLFADGKCFVGTPDVEGYFRTAAGL
ncbi:MAG TPA: hypothetical protein VN420_03630 [Candidatus Fimivivens sp.]|nr:hypothetical protein [Candidatus Fimivivens sp.]